MPGLTPEEIRAELILRKIKQVDIARSLGVSQAAVNRVISGDSVSQKIREEIAAILGRPVATIWPEQAA
ncbi:hypothetical protein SCACP_30520 [Sporomusa carbonis]|uniref:helix-turn-helix domain-containing protein n=1 Tax=Sporomusa carbonis TaxID=3076075 RepID=UPI003A6F0898